MKSILKLENKSQSEGSECSDINSVTSGSDVESENKATLVVPQQLNLGSTSQGSGVPNFIIPSLVLTQPPILNLKLPNPVQMANPNPRITNVVHIPYFLGRPGADPDTHIAKFEITCAANDIPPAKFQEVFAASLQEDAFAWYQRQPPFADWNALKNAFLAHFRPLGFASSLKEKLRTIRMGINERVDSYYGRMQDILQRMGAHLIPDNFLMSIFIGGLYPNPLKTYVKEGAPTTYAQAYGRAKVWEECRLEDELVVYTDNTYSNNPIPPNMGTFPVTNQNQHYITDARQSSMVGAPSYSRPREQSTPQDSTVAKHEDAIMNLTKQISELSVKVMRGAPRRPQTTNERTNVWCTNCKGHGHMANECPTPQGIRIKCTYCGGNHSVNECWNLKPQRPVNQIEDNRNRPWQEERTGPGPNSNYNPRKNFNRRPVNIDFPTRPSWGKTNGPPNWNGPPHNPNTRNNNANYNDRKKIPVCFRCQELGHYANECPNPRKSQDYVPLCGNCKTAGHPTDECSNPKKDYQSNERDWKKEKHVRIQEEDEAGGSRNVNHIQHTISPISSHPEPRIHAVATRSKRLIEPLPVPEGNSDDPSLSSDKWNSGDKLVPETYNLQNPVEVQNQVSGIPTPEVVHPTPETIADSRLHTGRIPHPTARVGLPIATVRPNHGSVKFVPTSNTTNLGNGYKKAASRRSRTMELATDLKQYDILSDLDNLKPQITMRQLLAIAPHCRSRLSTSMIRKKHKTVDIHDVTLTKDPGAPTVDVTIDGVMIPGFQVDTGSSVNLMSVETLNELGITNMTPTPIILKMADHTRTKPLGELTQTSAIIAGKEYRIDFIIFRTSDAVQPIPGILGRPWLILAQAKEDWGRGTLTLGRGPEKTVLPLFPNQYQGETQDDGTEFSSDDSNSETDELSSEPIHNIGSHHSQGVSLGMGEYYFPLDQGDSDDAILQWQKSVCNISTTRIPMDEHPLGGRKSKYLTEVLHIETSSPEEKTEVAPALEEDWEDAMFSSSTPIKSYVAKDVCKEMNLGTEEIPKIIKIYEKISNIEWKYWFNFFKRNMQVFAWTYKDLRGVPPEVCEHKIVLEEGATPVR